MVQSKRVPWETNETIDNASSREVQSDRKVNNANDFSLDICYSEDISFAPQKYFNLSKLWCLTVKRRTI